MSHCSSPQLQHYSFPGILTISVTKCPPNAAPQVRINSCIYLKTKIALTLTLTLLLEIGDSKQVISPELLNAHSHKLKHVPAFIRNVMKMSGPKRSIKITDHFKCTSANVIYCVTQCTLCKKLYIGETGRRLGDRFREHLRNVEKDGKNASKPVVRRVNLPNHSKQRMAVCGLSLDQGSTESRKTLQQKFLFQIGTLNGGET